MPSQVKVISSTTDIERHIAFCARVSNPRNQCNENFEGLLRYCIRHAHWSVFEHGSITLEIKTSRTLARQLLRHRSFTFQEFSQRYAVVPNEPFFVSARRQDTQNRQASIDDMDQYVKDWFRTAQGETWQYARERYQAALDMGIAKEQARMLLPEGACPTTLYMSGNIRSWIHFVQLRAGNGTQKEMELLALKCGMECLKLCPKIFKFVLEDYLRNEIVF